MLSDVNSLWPFSAAEDGPSLADVERQYSPNLLFIALSFSQFSSSSIHLLTIC